MVANSSKQTLPPREVHRHLVAALNELEQAQRNAVLWFGEVVRRKIYRELGYSSIYQYAELELGFKKAKTAQFLRLSDSLRELPELRQSVASGELSWTKAREVAKVATAKTESAWIREAKSSPRRVLETRVAETRRRARVGASGREQVTLEMGRAEDSCTGTEEERKVAADVPVDLQVRMTAEQYARYQALMETLAREGDRDKAELLLAGLEALTMGKNKAPSKGEIPGSTPEKFTG